MDFLDKEQEETDAAGKLKKVVTKANPLAAGIEGGMKVIGEMNKRRMERTKALAASVNQKQSNMTKGAERMTSVAQGFRL